MQALRAKNAEEMKTKEKKAIVDALKLLQKNLNVCLEAAEDCVIEIRSSGFNLIGPDGRFLIEDGEPKDVARALEDEHLR